MTERRPDDTAAAPAVVRTCSCAESVTVPLDGMPTPSVETDVLIRTGRITAVGQAWTAAVTAAAAVRRRSDLRVSDLEVYDGAGRFRHPGPVGPPRPPRPVGADRLGLDLSGVERVGRPSTGLPGTCALSRAGAGPGVRLSKRGLARRRASLSSTRSPAAARLSSSAATPTTAGSTRPPSPSSQGPRVEGRWRRTTGSPSRAASRPAGAAEAAAAAYRREVRRAHAEGDRRGDRPGVRPQPRPVAAPDRRRHRHPGRCASVPTPRSSTTSSPRGCGPGTRSPVAADGGHRVAEDHLRTARSTRGRHTALSSVCRYE